MSPLVAPDANLLLYSYDDKARDHIPARAWWESTLTSSFVGIPLQSILAFTRITTHPNYPGQRFTVQQSTAVVDSWLVRPNVSLLLPGVSHWSICRQMLLSVDARANLSTDAHLAALVIEHDATLYTADTDFARFPGLRWVNPFIVHG